MNPSSIFPLLFLGSIFLSSVIHFVSTEKILVAVFMSSKSHKITYMALLEELARRGHEITILSPIKPFKEVKGIREIYTLDAENLIFGDFNPVKMKEENRKTLDPFEATEKFATLCSKSYDLPQVKALFNETFDLVFTVPMANDCALGLLHKFNAPLVLFCFISAPGSLVSQLGGHHPPSFVANFFLDYSDEMSFKERFFNMGLTLFFEAFGKFLFNPRLEAIVREKLGEDVPSIREILSEASLLLSNGHFSVNGPKPNLPNVVDVAGIHSRPPKPLPKELEDFVSKSGKDGFILFSMGSIIKGEKQMSPEKIQMFRNVFVKLKQQVLWKWDSETMPNQPENVKLSKWLPQQDVLGHPNIKMFITHCGGGSTEEAIYHGVPLIGIPMFGDQLLNAKQANRKGIIFELDWNELTEETLTNAIYELLNNSSYRDNVQRLSKIFKDQPDEPLQRGVYWIEYVMRHKGAPQLKSAGRKLNLFQYHSIDVLAAYIAIIGLANYAIFVILKFFTRKIYGFCFGQKKSGSFTAQSNKKMN